jgi:hypothetical protein
MNTGKTIGGAENGPTQDRPAHDHGQGCAHCGHRPAEDKRRWRMDMLERLAELTMEWAQAAQRDAMEARRDAQNGLEMPTAKADPGLTFIRAAKAVRQTLALHARFEKDDLKGYRERQAREAPREAVEDEDDAFYDAARSRRRKDAVQRAVERVIDAEVDPGEHESLYEELNERLDDYEPFVDFGEISVGEMVFRLCRDFGFEPDWQRWSIEPWAIEEIQTRPKGSPYANWPDTGQDNAQDSIRENANPPKRKAKGQGPP